MCVYINIYPYTYIFIHVKEQNYNFKIKRNKKCRKQKSARDEAENVGFTAKPNEVIPVSSPRSLVLLLPGKCQQV